MKNTCIIIAGPTAVGKTSVAINLAKQFGTEVISADSRQCYREMKIGVARPSDAELAEVPHHFIASHSVTENITAAYFEKFALVTIAEIFSRNPVAVMVGGTGLYIKAFCEGMDAIPETDPELRKEILLDYEAKGMEWLQEAVRNEDADFYSKGEIRNPQRLMRALEVIRQTGQSILSFRKGEKAKRGFNIIRVGLDLPRELLYFRINQRVDEMMKQGLVDEVKALLPYEKLNALQTVGYQEIFRYLHGNISLDMAVAEIKKNTRHYAKRQLTWFRKDMEMHWFEPSDADQVKKYIDDHLEK